MTDPPPKPQWRWEAVNPSFGQAAGDFTKLFRNQAEKKPGFLAENAPGSNAYVMAREVIQNAWDAALELRKSPPHTSPPCPPPPPEKHFLISTFPSRSEPPAARRRRPSSARCA